MAMHAPVTADTFRRKFSHRQTSLANLTPADVPRAFPNTQRDAGMLNRAGRINKLRSGNRNLRTFDQRKQRFQPAGPLAP